MTQKMFFILFAFVMSMLNLGMQCTCRLTILNVLILKIKINLYASMKYRQKDVSQYIELACDKGTNIAYNNA